MQDIAFKPYACAPMTQPYIDCAIALAERGVEAAQINTIVCKVGAATVHRLWDPLAVKHAPRTPYAAKFSTPFCMAVAFFDRCAGLARFTQIADPRSCRPGARAQNPVRDRSAERISGQFHRSSARDAP